MLKKLASMMFSIMFFMTFISTSFAFNTPENILLGESFTVAFGSGTNVKNITDGRTDTHWWSQSGGTWKLEYIFEEEVNITHRRIGGGAGITFKLYDSADILLYSLDSKKQTFNSAKTELNLSGVKKVVVSNADSEYYDGYATLTEVALYSTPMPPNAPNVTATAGNEKVSLSWLSVSGADYYNIYKNGVYIDTTTDTSYIDEDVTNDVEYTYTVTAINEIGESIHSAEVSVVPKEISFLDMNYPVGPKDMITGALSFLGIFNGWVILTLAIIFTPILVWMIFWLVEKVRLKNMKTRDRKEMYMYLTKTGRTKERDEWVRKTGDPEREKFIFMTKSRKERIEREDRERIDRALQNIRPQRKERQGRT